MDIIRYNFKHQNLPITTDTLSAWQNFEAEKSLSKRNENKVTRN